MKSIILLLFFLSSITFSQENKTSKLNVLLTKVSKTKKDTLQVNLLNEIATEYQNTNPKTGVNFAKKALVLSKKIDWKKGEANSCFAIGLNYFILSDYSNSILNFENALQINSDELTKATILKSIGLAYSYQNNYPKALEYGTQSLKIFEKLKNKSGVAVALSNIGIVYCDWANYPKAIEFYNKALKINSAINNQVSLSQNLGNIANVYSLQKEDKKAILYYEKSLKISEKLNDLIGKSISLGSIASSYLNLKNYEKALHNSNAALSIAEKIGIEGIIGFLTSINADVYFEKGKKENDFLLIDKSVLSFKKALEIHKKINSHKEISSDYDYLSKVYNYKKDYKDALENYKLSIIYKDSVFNSENKETIKNIEDKRTIELRENEIKINKLTKKKQQWFFIFGISFLAIIGTLLFYQSRSRQKTNFKLQILNENLDEANNAKTKLLGILNHDLRSPVVNVIHFLHLQKNSPELLSANDKVEMETQTISSAENLLNSMEDILLWSKSQMDSFKPQPKKILISDLFNDTKNDFFSEKNSVISFENLENLELFTDENFLKIIIRNLTNNAIKVQIDAKNSTIIWKCYTKNGAIYLSISDNGKGANLNKFKALYDEKEVIGIQNGLGLHLIRDLAKAICCEIEVQSEINKGTIFILKF